VKKNELGGLHELAVFLETKQDLRRHLGELVERAASVTGASSCSIMLLSEGDNEVARLKLWASTEKLPSEAWNETPAHVESIAGRVLEHGISLLVSDVRESEFALLARDRGGLGPSFICTPIRVGADIIGVMNLSNRLDRPPFDKAHLGLAEIVAILIGKSIQVQRLQTLIQSRVAQATLAREEKEVVARLTDGTLPPARLAKMLAKSFFKDLSAAGFEPGQIIEAASEIITLVSSDIARYKKRLARKTE
jgi:L-methionine (R)-S-oxide reductase